MCVTASTPETCGIMMSRIIRSGNRRRARSTASRPSLASPATSMPAASSRSRTTWRTTAESSAMTTRGCSAGALPTNQLLHCLQERLLLEITFDDVRLRSSFAAALAFFGRAQRGHDDARHAPVLGIAPQDLDELESRHAGHLHVGHHQI